MAGIRKTLCGTYEVYGYRLQADGNKQRFSKTFKTRAEAKRFAAELDISAEERSSSITLAALIDEYISEVTSQKRSKRTEEIRLRRLQRDKLAAKTLSSFTNRTIENYIERRLSERAKNRDNYISPSTVNRELTILSDVFQFAIKNELTDVNPCRGVEKPREPEHRERVASDEDIEKLLQASGWDGHTVPKNKMQLAVAAFLFSCQTGMRAGELLKIEYSWLGDNVLHVPAEATKTLSRRDVALSARAREILKLVMELEYEPRIFGGLNDHNRDTLFRKVRDRAGLGPEYDSQNRLIKEGLNFHDGRATFATWAASPDPETGAPRLDVLALSRQTGHKDLKMLQRYYRASAEEIAKRLK